MRHDPANGGDGEADLDAEPAISDAPTHADRWRIRLARRDAQVRYSAIAAIYEAETKAAFRAELSAVVRSASALLVSLLDANELVLDSVLTHVTPDEHWRGDYSILPDNTTAQGHLLFPYTEMPARLLLNSLLCVPNFRSDHDELVRIKLIEHSLEVDVLGPEAWVTTRFGELRIRLSNMLPETLAVTCVGRMIDEVVDHYAWRGTGWRIIGVEDAYPPHFGQTLVVAAASTPYRITWPQATV